MNYGKAIKIIRSAKGLEQRGLASVLNLDPSYISLLEKGKRKPNQRLITLISNKLAIPKNLFQLLASEKQDLKNIKEEEATNLARHLLRILVTSYNDKYQVV